MALGPDLQLATQALDRGDLAHAAHHLGGAIADAPTDRRVLALVDRFATRGDAALDAVPLGQGAFHGTVALHALLLARRGDTAESVGLLWQCLGAVPDVDYLPCIESIVQDPAAVARLDGQGVTATALRVFDRLPRPTQVRASDLLVRISDAHPEDDWAFFAACVAVRKSGRAEQSEALGVERVRTRPSYWAYVALAGARRERGHLEGAVDAFRAAVRLKPDEIGCLLDCGDLLIELERPVEALQAYEEALAVQPGHPWAHPSALYLRARAGDGAAREELLGIAGAPDAGDRARALATELLPFVFDLPARRDACLKLAEDGRERVTAVATSCIEAPSAYQVVRRLCGMDLRLTASVPDPDPRLPRTSVPFTLWRYRAPGWRRLLGAEMPVEAEPAVPAPAAEAAEEIADLAGQPYVRRVWWERAGGIAERLGDEARATALGSMVHWPPAPEGVRLADFAFRVQVAGAYVLARLGDREGLEILLDGPVDWAGTAALVALTEMAVRSGDHRAGERVVAVALDEDVNPVRWQCLIEPALHLAALLPDLPAHTLARLLERRREGAD